MGVLLLVRHGQASLGTADYDRLSDIGRRQAQVTGARLAGTDLAVDRMVSGGLTRQRDTAQAVLDALGWPASRLRIDERLDEYDHVEVMARHTTEVTFQTATAEGEVGRALQSTLEEAIGRWISGETSYSESHAAFIDRVLAAVGHLVAEPGGTVAVDLGRGHRGLLRSGAGAARRALAQPGPTAGQRQHHQGHQRAHRNKPGDVQRPRPPRNRPRPDHLPVAGAGQEGGSGGGAGRRAQAWMAAPQATRSAASGRPQAVSASVVCWPGTGAGPDSWPGVLEKRGAGAGWTTPSRTT